MATSVSWQKLTSAGVPFDKIMKNIELIATEILPAVKKYTADKSGEFTMKIALLAGSKVGSKTRTAMEYTKKIADEKYPEAEITLLDLAEFEMVFSDGRIIGNMTAIQNM